MIYFIIEDTNEKIKIGRAKNIEKRRKGLQNANSRELLLLGWIRTDEDVKIEKEIHRHFSSQRVAREWFDLEPGDVLPILESFGIDGFVGTTEDSFRITGYGRDGIPEYLGVWSWGDLEIEECCPFCGSFCGMHFQEASSMYNCINCDELTLFDFLDSEEE